MGLATAFRFPKRLEHIGATAFYTDQLWASSLLSYLLMAIDKGTFSAVACNAYSKYDETPLTMRSLEVEQSDTTDLLQGHPPQQSTQQRGLDTAGSPATGINSFSGRKLCKVYQMRTTLGILLKVHETGGFLSLEIPIATPLAIADTNNAEVLNHIMNLNSHISLWTTMESACEHKFSTSTSDGAKSNLRYAVHQAYKSHTTMRLRMTCHVHLLNGVHKQAYYPLSKIISGLVAAALTMRTVGGTLKFQQALQHCSNN